MTVKKALKDFLKVGMEPIDYTTSVLTKDMGDLMKFFSERPVLTFWTAVVYVVAIATILAGLNTVLLFLGTVLLISLGIFYAIITYKHLNPKKREGI